MVAFAALGTLPVSSGVAQEIPWPEPVTVSAHGLTARAALGTFCGESTDPPDGSDRAPADFCADAGYPLRTRGRLPVEGRSRLRIRTGEPARSVRANLVRVRSHSFRFVSRILRARRIRGSKRLWRLRLPRDLRRANVLDIDVIYPSANGNWWAGLCAGCVPPPRG
jgi:hypothetical protein